MKENKHNRFLFRLSTIFSLAFNIFPVIVGIMYLVGNRYFNVHPVALCFGIGIAIISFPLAIYALIMGKQPIKEFKAHYMMINIFMVINTLAIIPCLIAFKLAYFAIGISAILLISNVFYIYEIKLNEKYYIGQELAIKAQMAQISENKFNEKLIDENMKTEENMNAFGKVAAPLTREQKIIQQIKEINILYEAGMMDDKEYARLKETIMEKTI